MFSTAAAQPRGRGMCMPLGNLNTLPHWSWRCFQPVKHNLQNKKKCRKCVAAHVAQWERSRRYTRRPRVQVTFWPFSTAHCPLPTAHCPLLTCRPLIAQESSGVESRMSRHNLLSPWCGALVMLTHHCLSLSISKLCNGIVLSLSIENVRHFVPKIEADR